MTQRGQQVRIPHVILGAAAHAVVVALLVALSHWLLLPEIQVPGLPEPPVIRACPERLAALPVHVTSDELFECPDAFDGRLVRYEGEAVGAVLGRGSRSWVQLNDDPYALVTGPMSIHRAALGGNSGVAVSLPRDVAEGITLVGRHTVRGDVLSVTGVFQRADPADGGGPTIQVSRLDAIRPGHHLRDPVSARRIVVAAALLGATGLLAVAVRRRRTPSF